MEVLIASAILASASLAFLAVLSETRADLAQARGNGEAASLARQLILEAQAEPRATTDSGVRGGLAWARDCQIGAARLGARLVLGACTISIARAGHTSAPLLFESVWVMPAQSNLR